MTETQAKSGAAGASTDAEDPAVASSEADGTEGSTTKSSSDSGSGSSSTPPVAPASTPVTPPKSATSGPAYTPTPLTVSTPLPPASVSSSPPATPVVASRPDDVKPSIPVVAVPASIPTPPPTPPAFPPAPAAWRSHSGSTTAPGSAPSSTPAAVPPPGSARPPGTPTGSPPLGGGLGAATGTAAGRATAAPKATTSGPATGTASVSAPVIARATVTGTTTVTGTGIRQTTGSTPVVTPSRTGAVGAARVTDAVRSARATVTGAASRGPRRARLHLKRIDPWSVMKFAFAVSLVLFVVAIVATSVLYLALDAMGVWDSINQAFADVTGQAGGPADAFKITAKGVIGTSVLLGAVNMVLFTALMTLSAFVYNVCADLVGGVELTLSEKE